MKSVFTLNTHIESAISRYDLPKLINAVQASLNSASLQGEDSKRGNVKLVKDKAGNKAANFRFTESTQAKYEGRTDAPARFARWHDALASVFNKAGEPSGELTVDVVPAGLKAWLDEKFSLTPADTTKGNGKRRNGDVKPNVPSPAAPTA